MHVILQKIYWTGATLYYYIDTIIFMQSTPTILKLPIFSKGNLIGIIDLVIMDTKGDEKREILPELACSWNISSDTSNGMNLPWIPLIPSY